MLLEGYVFFRPYSVEKLITDLPTANFQQQWFGRAAVRESFLQRQTV